MKKNLSPESPYYDPALHSASEEADIYGDYQGGETGGVNSDQESFGHCQKEQQGAAKIYPAF